MSKEKKDKKVFKYKLPGNIKYIAVKRRYIESKIVELEENPDYENYKFSGYNFNKDYTAVKIEFKYFDKGEKAV